LLHFECYGDLLLVSKQRTAYVELEEMTADVKLKQQHTAT